VNNVESQSVYLFLLKTYRPMEIGIVQIVYRVFLENQFDVKSVKYLDKK